VIAWVKVRGYKDPVKAMEGGWDDGVYYFRTERRPHDTDAPPDGWYLATDVTQTSAPEPTLAEKEAAANSQEGWRRRRDAHLKGVFHEPPRRNRSDPDWG
jgi:hypothetical protein